MTACAHMVGGRCTHALALPLYGARPSPGVCHRCEHYDGPARGLGDRIERVARVTGAKTVTKCVEKATGLPCGCAKRRARWNKAMPSRKAREDVERGCPPESE